MSRLGAHDRRLSPWVMAFWALLPPVASVLAVALEDDPAGAFAPSAFRRAIEEATLWYYAASGVIALLGSLFVRPRMAEVAIGVGVSITLAVLLEAPNLLPFALAFQVPALAMALAGAAAGGRLRA